MEPKHYRYVFVEDVPDPSGDEPFRKGDEIFYMHGCFYFNGGLVSPYYQRLFEKMIDEEEENGYEHMDWYNN